MAEMAALKDWIAMWQAGPPAAPLIIGPEFQVFVLHGEPVDVGVYVV